MASRVSRMSYKRPLEDTTAGPAASHACVRDGGPRALRWNAPSGTRPHTGPSVAGCGLNRCRPGASSVAVACSPSSVRRVSGRACSRDKAPSWWSSRPPNAPTATTCGRQWPRAPASVSASATHLCRSVVSWACARVQRVSREGTGRGARRDVPGHATRPPPRTRAPGRRPAPQGARCPGRLQAGRARTACAPG